MAVDLTNVTASIDWGNVLQQIPGISSLVKVGITVGIVVIVYVVFLIIRSITQILYSLRFKKLTKNVEEINKKMDVLIGKTKKEEKIKNKKLTE